MSNWAARRRPTSGTKPIVAAQVMLPVEAGEISLSAPATDYLPADFTFDINGATIRDLLSHRSGIPDFYGLLEDDFATDRLRDWEPDGVKVTGRTYHPFALRPASSLLTGGSAAGRQRECGDRQGPAPR